MLPRKLLSLSSKQSSKSNENLSSSSVKSKKNSVCSLQAIPSESEEESTNLAAQTQATSSSTTISSSISSSKKTTVTANKFVSNEANQEILKDILAQAEKIF